MRNIIATYEKGEIVLRIPCTKDSIRNAPLSQSQKTRLIASTQGNASVEGAPEGVKIGVNVFGPV